jgi:DNA-directed RNA polymerase specialized sigma24 family protein
MVPEPIDKEFRQQLEHVYKEDADMLCRTLKTRLHVRDDHMVQDARDEAFARILDGHGNFDGRKGSLRGYIFSTMCRVAIDMMRARDNCWQALLDPQSDAWKNVPSSSHLRTCASRCDNRNGLVPALYQVIREELSPQERAVVLADIQAGGTADVRTVVESVGISKKGTVYVVRCKAREKIREGLARRGYVFDTLKD